MRRLCRHGRLAVLLVAIVLKLQGCGDEEDSNDGESKEETKAKNDSAGNETNTTAEAKWSGQHRRSSYGGPPAQLGHFDETQKKVLPDHLPGKGDKPLDAERAFERALLSTNGAERQAHNLEKQKHLEEYYKHTKTSTTPSPFAATTEGGEAAEAGAKSGAENATEVTASKDESGANSSNSSNTSASLVEPLTPAAKVGAGKEAPTGTEVKEELAIEHAPKLATPDAPQTFKSVESAGLKKKLNESEEEEPLETEDVEKTSGDATDEDVEKTEDATSPLAKEPAEETQEAGAKTEERVQSPESGKPNEGEKEHSESAKEQEALKEQANKEEPKEEAQEVAKKEEEPKEEVAKKDEEISKPKDAATEDASLDPDSDPETKESAEGEEKESQDSGEDSMDEKSDDDMDPNPVAEEDDHSDSDNSASHGDAWENLGEDDDSQNSVLEMAQKHASRGGHQAQRTVRSHRESREALLELEVRADEQLEDFRKKLARQEDRELEKFRQRQHQELELEIKRIDAEDHQGPYARRKPPGSRKMGRWLQELAEAEG